MHGIEVLLCEFVCALTLMIFMQIWLLADPRRHDLLAPGGLLPQGAGPVQRQSRYGQACTATRSIFGNGMPGDCSLSATSCACSHRRGSPGMPRSQAPHRGSVQDTHLGCVDVVAHFWRQPSHAENVPRIVEMNDLLQRLEIAVVAVRLHELPGWPQVDIAQGWDLMLAPLSHVNRLRITRSLEEASEASINPVIT